ncbi:MAG: hypothetical protein KDA84_09375, partial [Planctomycetaceae bacterium]|nr:hypothetical protein [Planctomycetaceae bacterium]
YKRRLVEWIPEGDEISPPTQVVWERDGLVVRRESGQIDLIEDSKSRSLLPPEPAGFPGEWKDVTHLGESGRWLMVSALKQGLFAYHQDRHSWQQISKTDVTDWQLTPLGVYVLQIDSSLLFLEFPATGPVTRKLNLPGNATATRLLQVGNSTLAWTKQGELYELKEAQALANPRISPSPLPTTDRPVIQAAIEWDNHLLMAYMGANKEGQIAIYSPNTAQWKLLPVAEGNVTRFLSLTAKTEQRMFAEVVMKKTVPGEGPRQLFELKRKQFGVWETQALPGTFVDLAATENSLWCVQPDGRIAKLSPDNQWRLAGLETGDELPNPIQSAHVVGEELVALLSDGAIWHYSLDQLKWRRELANILCSALVVAQDQVFAIEKPAGVFHAFDPKTKKWGAVPKQGFGKTIVLNAKGNAEAVKRWKLIEVDGKPTFSWSATDDEKSQFERVTFSQSRFDFNRFQEIEIQNGTLWAKTTAQQNEKPVFRKFQIENDKVTELATGDARFALDPDVAIAALKPPSSLEFSGPWFQFTTQNETHPLGWKVQDSATGETLLGLLNLKQIGSMRDQESLVQLIKLPGGGYGLDIDQWLSVTSSGNRLCAKTSGGVLAIAFPKNSPSFQRVAWARTLSVPVGLVETAPGVIAKIDDDTYLSFSDEGEKWDSKTQPDIKTQYADAGTRLAMNRWLADWKVTRDDNTFGLERKVREKPDEFLPVTLGKRGFGFDQVKGIELRSKSVRFYTPDGRVTNPRQPIPPADADVVFRLEGDYRVPETKPGQVITDGEELVFLEESSPQTVWQYQGGWNKLPPAERDAFLEKRGAVLHDQDGWKWHADDRVELSIAPFTNQPVAARYDSSTGQFSFDQARNHQFLGKELHVVTDSGVFRWMDQKVTGAELTELNQKQNPLAAEFLNSLDGTPLLQIEADKNQTVYGHQENWNGDLADELTAKWEDAAQWLHAGSQWKAKRTDANPSKDNPADTPRARVFLKRDGKTETQVELQSDRRWNFESVAGMAGTPDQPRLATADGLWELKKASEPL